jgi:MFS family permease
VLRFLVGVAIGSEWATGASIVSELWPDHARGKGGGLLQCGAGLGSILASLVWLAITSETLGGAIGAAYATSPPGFVPRPRMARS